MNWTLWIEWAKSFFTFWGFAFLGLMCMIGTVMVGMFILLGLIEGACESLRARKRRIAMNNPPPKGGA